MSATALARNVKSCLSAAVTHDLTSTVLGTNTSKNYLKPSHESSIGYFMRSVFSLLRYIMNQYDNFAFCVIDSLDSQSLKWKRPFLELRLDFASPGIGPRPFTICSFCMLAMATPKKNTWRTANEAMLSAIAPILSGDSIQFHSGSGKTKTETGKFLSRGKS